MLGYRVEITRGGAGYIATFPKLPGCFAEGTTIETTIAECSIALKSWLRAARGADMRFEPPDEFIPLPKDWPMQEWYDIARRSF